MKAFQIRFWRYSGQLAGALHILQQLPQWGRKYLGYLPAVRLSHRLVRGRIAMNPGEPPMGVRPGRMFQVG
jgi:hypothetical protein